MRIFSSCELSTVVYPLNKLVSGISIARVRKKNFFREQFNQFSLIKSIIILHYGIKYPISLHLNTARREYFFLFFFFSFLFLLSGFHCTQKKVILPPFFFLWGFSHFFFFFYFYGRFKDTKIRKHDPEYTK